MKPIVLITEKSENGNVVLSVECFKKYIEDAYNQGYTDALRNDYTYKIEKSIDSNSMIIDYKN